VPSLTSGNQSDDLICEIRRTSFCGRESFDFLLNSVAIRLKEKGLAKRFSNGFEIFSDLYDLCDTSEIDLSSGNYPVRLSKESAKMMISRAAKRSYPYHGETLRLLTKFSAGDKGNCEVLKMSDELRKVVLNELRYGSKASTCLNALKLIELDATVPKEAFPWIGRCMILYCSIKPEGFQGMRSQAIENAALGAMKALGKRINSNQRETAFLTIKKDLVGKLSDELYRKVQAIFNCRG